MAKNLLLDAQLSKDSYTFNNSGSGASNGWTRMRVTEYKLPTTVETGSNFAAQMYQGADGTYKIAFRGTASLTGEGDRIHNVDGIVAGKWTSETQQAMEFTTLAIQQVAREKGIEFKEAAKLFTVTGHSQGGFEAELVSKMFGLPGTSLDGPGASRMIGTEGYQAAKAAIQKQEPGAVLDASMPDFTARLYTIAVGGLNPHMDGVEVSTSRGSLVVQGSLFSTGVGALASFFFQATVFHDLGNIIAIEKARAQIPVLQKIVQSDDAGDSALSLATVVSDRWAYVQAAAGGGGISANDVQDMLSTFLSSQEGQALVVKEFERTLYVQSSNGDTLILMPDGSGVSTSMQGIQLTQKEYAKGGVLIKTVQAQRDDDGNLLVQSAGKGFSFVGTEDINGRMTQGIYKTFDASGQFINTSNTYVTYTPDGQATKVTETVNHLAKGTDIASSKVLDTSGGAKIINSTTAEGHIQEETYATVNGKQTLQSSKTLSYSQAERDTAALDVSLAGLEFMQALRSGNKLQAAGSLIRLVNNAEIASNKMPTLGAIGTGFAGAVSLISALDSWGNASDGERIALTARAVLGANDIARSLSVDGKTGFLESGPALGALQGIVALASLDATLKSGNPFAIASSMMSITNAGAALLSQSAVFGPQVMICVAIASILFSSLFGGETQYPAPPPAGQGELGVLSDGSLGMVFKDAEGKAYQTRKLTGEVFSDSGKAIDGQNWGMGADVLSGRMQSLITDLKEQASKDGTHLILERLPSLSVHAFPSFDRNGVDNFFFGIHFKDPGTGAQQMAAAANSDVLKQFKELAAYVGVAVGATEWAQIQAKRAAGDVYATETEGQFVDRLSGPSQAERLALKQLDLFDANKDGKFVALAANVPQYLLSA